MTKSAIDEMHDNINSLKATEDITDEVKQKDDVELEKEGDEEIEYTAVELDAMKKGWNPDKEAVPEGKEWIEAGEFLRNEKFFSEIRKLKRENNMTRKALDELKDHHKKVAEMERDKLLTQLKRQKVEALEESEHAKVIEIDEQIAEVKEQAKATDKAIESETATVATQEEWAEAYSDWIDANPWYKNNNDMRDIADELGRGYYATHNGNIVPTDLYKHVEDRIKKLYPAEFGIKTKRRAQAVEGASARGAGRSAGKSKYTVKDLSDEQRQVMNRFIKTGAIDTPEQYINELVKIGELS